MTDTSELMGEPANESVVAGQRIGWPEFALTIGLAGCFAFLPHVSLGHDPVWQMWVGRHS